MTTKRTTKAKGGKKQTWDVGDCFTLTLCDGSFSVGQVIGYEPEAMNSAICAFYAQRFPNRNVAHCNGLTDDLLVAVLFVTRDLIDSGDWAVGGHEAPIDAYRYFDLIDLKANGFVGLKIIGSGIVIDLMNAYFGLQPWDDFHNRSYLDGLLVSPDRRPANVVLLHGK